MEKYQGKATTYAPVKQNASQVIISYGLQPLPGTDDATWQQAILYKKQNQLLTLDVVKEAVIAHINQRVREAIISGLEWKGKPVWLSEENQLNFAQAIAPATLKIGETADGHPVYETFDTQADLDTFNRAWIAHRQQCLTQGWQEKDSIDWQPYADALPKADEQGE